MATLYRCRTPTDWLCPCGRVARELRRAGEEVEVVRVPWRRRDRREVEALTGQRVVPVAVIDSEAICDSHRIVEHLEWRSSQDPA
ncbi:glutathione S-transferase N-terminal domain-containing protein [Paraconexibacter sp.]|uniref:glutathione S-transferase N-terminal domain-containing protein n=1 Tax=Paraconexibacter sp. TaxID=2949640 RepID=UPI0035632773